MATETVPVAATAPESIAVPVMLGWFFKPREWIVRTPDGNTYRLPADAPPLPGMSESTLARMAEVRAAWERGDLDM